MFDARFVYSMSCLSRSTKVTRRDGAMRRHASASDRRPIVTYGFLNRRRCMSHPLRSRSLVLACWILTWYRHSTLRQGSTGPPPSICIQRSVLKVGACGCLHADTLVIMDHFLGWGTRCMQAQTAFCPVFEGCAESPEASGSSGRLKGVWVQKGTYERGTRRMGRVSAICASVSEV